MDLLLLTGRFLSLLYEGPPSLMGAIDFQGAGNGPLSSNSISPTSSSDLWESTPSIP